MSKIQGQENLNGVKITLDGIQIEFKIEADDAKFSEFSVSRKNIFAPTRDCVDLGNSSNINWFGGNQQHDQYWPIQKQKHVHNDFVTKEAFSNSIMERYWLNSNGVFFYVDQTVPLFLDQNNEDIGFLCFEAQKKLPYDTQAMNFDFTYKVGVANDARISHMEAVVRHLKKATGYP